MRWTQIDGSLHVTSIVVELSTVEFIGILIKIHTRRLNLSAAKEEEEGSNSSALHKTDLEEDEKLSIASYRHRIPLQSVNMVATLPRRIFFRPLANLRTISSICSWRPSLSNVPPLAHRRTVTNATKPDYIPKLQTVPRVDAKPGGWLPTLVHSSGEVKFTVIRLKPGDGEVPKHFHNKVWDYFMPLEGEAVIETETKHGVKKDYEMRPGSFLAVGPEDVHRVRNTSKDREFVFFLAQAPRNKYDFIPIE